MYDLIDVNSSDVHGPFLKIADAHGYAWERKLTDYVIFEGQQMVGWHYEKPAWIGQSSHSASSTRAKNISR
jgi:hypothetical protein